MTTRVRGLFAFWIALHAGLTLACDKPAPEAAPPAVTNSAPELDEPTTVPPTTAAQDPSTAAQDPTTAAQVDEPESDRPSKPPKSRLLVPEDATAVGTWLDTHSYSDGALVAIYEQDGHYYFSMAPREGSIMRVALDRESDTKFVAHKSEYEEVFEIRNGNLVTRDKDGPIGTSKPYVE